MVKTIDECFFQIQNGANIKQGDVDDGFPITRIETTANDKFNRDRMGYAGITDISKYESYVLEDGDLRPISIVFSILEEQYCMLKKLMRP